MQGGGTCGDGGEVSSASPRVSSPGNECVIAAHHFLPPLRHEIFQRTLLPELFVSLNERQLFLERLLQMEGRPSLLRPARSPARGFAWPMMDIRVVSQESVVGAQGNDGYENAGEGDSAHLDFDAAVDGRPAAPFSDFATFPVSFSLPPTASDFAARSCEFLVIAFGMPLWVRCCEHYLFAEPPPLPSHN